MRRSAALLLMIVVAVLLAGLGVWQVERRAWKLDLIERTQRRLAAAPGPLPARASWPRIGRDDEYRRVRARGRWAGVRPAFVQALTDYGSGWWVMQPLVTDDGAVLVNRGFVAQQAPAPPVPAGPVVVTGLLRMSEAGNFLRRNDPARDRWSSRDVAGIARARGVRSAAPFFIDRDADAAPASRAAPATVPRGGLTVVDFPNNHLAYAMTWFALSAMAGWFAWRIAREPREVP